MIVTPIAQGTVQGNIETSAPHSPDAIERAKAAFTGVTTSRSDTPEDEYITKKRQSIRTLKMKTNASPERFLEEIKAAPENAISTTTEQTKVGDEETKPLSPQFAALARERRALQVKERELLAKEAALTSKGTQGSPDLLARLREQPLSVLQEAGVTYDQLTEAILNSPTVNPEIQSLKDEIKSLREGIDKNFTERDTQSEQQVLADMRRDAIDLAKQGEEFGMVRETNSINDVMALIERTYRATGEVLDVQEALTLVEAELMKEALKIANINKIKSTFAPPPQPQQLQRQMRTLTNRDTATPPMSAKARAIAAFQGTLKK